MDKTIINKTKKTHRTGTNKAETHVRKRIRNNLLFWARDLQ